MPNAAQLFPASYLRLWDHAEKTDGLYSFLKAGGTLHREGVQDVRENGASYLAQGFVIVPYSYTVRSNNEIAKMFLFDWIAYHRL